MRFLRALESVIETYESSCRTKFFMYGMRPFITDDGHVSVGAYSSTGFWRSHNETTDSLTGDEYDAIVVFIKEQIGLVKKPRTRKMLKGLLVQLGKTPEERIPVVASGAYYY